MTNFFIKCNCIVKENICIKQNPKILYKNFVNVLGGLSIFLELCSFQFLSLTSVPTGTRVVDSVKDIGKKGHRGASTNG